MTTTTTTETVPASITAAATNAASGLDHAARASVLPTPVSGTYPSEIRSPLAGTPALLRREDSIKTPITPPSAYVDFLNSFSPALMSPPTTSGSSQFTNAEPTASTSARSSLSQPPLSRHTSSDSSSSYTTVSTSSTESIVPARVAGERRERPESPRIIIPGSSFVKPASAGGPRRLHIPQSPFSAASVRSPMSSRSMQSPYSANPWSASFSPRTPYTAEEGKGKSGRVCVRQVVTRTVTYCRTPLDPAPRGKRRKVEDAAGLQEVDRDSDEAVELKKEKEVE